MNQEMPDPWDKLRTFTAARIALGRAGQSLPTPELLRFQLAHAQARDAVYSELDTGKLRNEIIKSGLQALLLQSQAGNRSVYVKRPDLGRKLDADSVLKLNQFPKPAIPFDLSLVLADGLSARAVQEHALPLVLALVPQLEVLNWSLAPIIMVTCGRVAIGDQIGHLLGAQMVAVLIGERPGLSSPDSLGIYLTYQPRPGLTDESRNCISNVRPEGLSFQFAAAKMHYLLTEMRTRKLSGVQLKDEMPPQLPG
jgi:ethanolamine ammonia-lyase small subunit